MTGVGLRAGDVVTCRTGEFAGAVGVVLSDADMLVGARTVPLDLGAVLRLGARLDADALITGDVERVLRSVRLDADADTSGESLLRDPGAAEPASSEPGAVLDVGSLVLVPGKPLRLGVVAGEVVDGAPLGVNLDGLVWAVPVDDVVALGISVDWAVTWGDEEDLQARVGHLVHVGAAPLPDPDDAAIVDSLAGVLADPVLGQVWQRCRANPETGGVDRVLLAWFGGELAQRWDDVPEPSRRVLWAAVEDAQGTSHPTRVGRAWLEDLLEILVLHRSWAGDSADEMLALAGPAAREHARLFRNERWHRAEVTDAD